MNRHFSFKWYKNEKYREPMERVNSVTVTEAPADTGLAAKAATNLFTKSFGSLKTNTIISIQEYNENGPIGEPIVPSDENDIVPVKK
jgi:hypothetical protein